MQFNHILVVQRRKDQWGIKIICCYYILLDFDVTLHVCQGFVKVGFPAIPAPPRRFEKGGERKRYNGARPMQRHS